jgi:hypothetical protein
MGKQKQSVKHQAVAGMISVAIMIWGAVQCTSESEPTKKNENTKMIESYVVAQSIVQGKLKSPSTAEFPGAYEYVNHITKIDSTTYEINSFVDSQNGFGATVRAYWTMKVHYEGENITRWNNFKFKQ